MKSKLAIGEGGKIVLADGTEIRIRSWQMIEAPEAVSKSLTFGIHWMRPCQIPEVLDIDDACFVDSWHRCDWLAAMQDRKAVCKVAIVGNQILGFSVWGLEKQKLYLIRLAIHPEIQRACVGSALLADGLKRLSYERRPTAWCCVDEKNLEAQLWLKANGWIATGLENGSIVFVFRVEWRESIP